MTRDFIDIQILMVLVYIYKINRGNAFALVKDKTIIDVSRNINELQNSARVLSKGSAYTDKYFILYPGIDEGISLLQHYGFTTSGYTGAENIQEIYNMRQQFCLTHRLVPNVYIGDKPIITGYDALFDDNPYLVQKWLNSDTQTKIYLIEQPYNVGFKFSNENGRVCRCKSFYEATQKFIKDKQKIS